MDFRDYIHRFDPVPRFVREKPILSVLISIAGTGVFFHFYGGGPIRWFLLAVEGRNEELLSEYSFTASDLKADLEDINELRAYRAYLLSRNDLGQLVYRYRYLPSNKSYEIAWFEILAGTSVAGEQGQERVRNLEQALILQLEAYEQLYLRSNRLLYSELKPLLETHAEETRTLGYSETARAIRKNIERFEWFLEYEHYRTKNGEPIYRRIYE